MITKRGFFCGDLDKMWYKKVPFVRTGNIFSSDFVFKEMKVKMSRYPLFTTIKAISYSSIIDHYILIVKLEASE